MEKKEDIEIIEEEETAEEKEDIMKQANVSLILDTYGDIFSSFDARPYSEKALSVDFLAECKNAVRDKGEFEIELRLLMPKEKRNLKDESTIKKRLKTHFGRHSLEKEEEIKNVRREGVIWVGIGALIMLSVLYGFIKITNEVLSAFVALFEIPSWFLVWEGMSKIFLESRKLEPDYKFYKKMANVQITFLDY